MLLCLAGATGTAWPARRLRKRLLYCIGLGLGQRSIGHELSQGSLTLSTLPLSLSSALSLALLVTRKGLENFVCLRLGYGSLVNQTCQRFLHSSLHLLGTGIAGSLSVFSSDRWGTAVLPTARILGAPGDTQSGSYYDCYNQERKDQPLALCHINISLHEFERLKMSFSQLLLANPSAISG